MFVVHKSDGDFSALAIDHTHEQTNAFMKGDGGAVGITEDPSALGWIVSEQNNTDQISFLQKV